MFTGIIAEVGEVRSIARRGSSAALEVACKKIRMAEPSPGDSVSVNGVCLSIAKGGKDLFFDVSDNTLKRTNLKRLKAGDRVNLEGALKAGDAIGGHLVSGHVDGERKVKSNRKASQGWVLDIASFPADEKYLIPRGSVAVDGVSLTVAEVSRGYFRIFLIPQTLENTTLALRRTGDYVNIEFDMMSKYAEKAGRRRITLDTLAEKGFI